jgi:hypothetical protein
MSTTSVTLDRKKQRSDPYRPSATTVIQGLEKQVRVGSRAMHSRGRKLSRQLSATSACQETAGISHEAASR